MAANPQSCVLLHFPHHLCQEGLITPSGMAAGPVCHWDYLPGVLRCPETKDIVKGSRQTLATITTDPF